MPHIRIHDSDQHWFRKWPVAYSAPSHYLNQCWVIVKWTPRNKLQCNFDKNKKRFSYKNVYENIVCELAAILFRGRWGYNVYLRVTSSSSSSSFSVSFPLSASLLPIFFLICSCKNSVKGPWRFRSSVKVPHSLIHPLSSTTIRSNSSTKVSEFVTITRVCKGDDEHVTVVSLFEGHVASFTKEFNLLLAKRPLKNNRRLVKSRVNYLSKRRQCLLKPPANWPLFHSLFRLAIKKLTLIIIGRVNVEFTKN